MADEKLTALTEFAGTLAGDDLLYMVDVSDTTQDVAGSSFKVPMSALGGRFLIEEITLGSAGEFDFNSIPAGFNRLIITGLVRGDVSATSDLVYVILNADTTLANYHSQRIAGIDNTAFATEFDNQPLISGCPGASSPSGLYGALTIVIEDYAGSHRKAVGCDSFVPRDASTLEASKYITLSSITAAITRVRIRTDNHSTDQLLGTLRLYGEF